MDDEDDEKSLTFQEWRNMEGYNSLGRFVPNLIQSRDRTHEIKTREETYGEFMRRRQNEEQPDTEINVQIGDFTLKTSRLQVLEQSTVSMPDFVEVFGSRLAQLQCAEGNYMHNDTHNIICVVKNTEHRRWVRLVGLRHDLLLWTPDTRSARLNFNRQ